MTYQVNSPTSVLVPLRIVDATGSPVTGLTFNSAGLAIATKSASDAVWANVPLVAATVGTWTSGGFVEDADGDGWYQLGLPDGQLSPGVQLNIRVDANGNGYRYGSIRLFAADAIAQAVIDAATALVAAGAPPVVIPPATGASDCNVALDVVDYHTLPVAGAVLTVASKLNPLWADASHLTVPVQTPPTSDVNGRILVKLARSTKYRLTITTLLGQAVSLDYETPNASSALIQRVTV